MASQSLNLPYLLLTGAIVIAAVFLFTVVKPAFNAVAGVKTEIAARQAKIAEREAFLRTRDAKLAELEANRENEVRLEIVLPRTDRMEDALRVLHEAAQSNGLDLEEISNNSEGLQSEARSQQARGESEALPAGAVPLGLQVALSGPYQGWRGLLANLEHSPRLTNVVSMNLKADEQKPDVLHGSLSLEFYMLGGGQP